MYFLSLSIFELNENLLYDRKPFLIFWHIRGIDPFCIFEIFLKLDSELFRDRISFPEKRIGLTKYIEAVVSKV